MTSILGISGSLRAGSFNTALLQAATTLSIEGITVEAATLHGVPLYDGDLEAADGAPAAVKALAARIQAADGVLLVSPEYNNGIPGVFKNAIDWLSRPVAGAPALLDGKPVAVVGASPGGFGTVLAQNHWLPVLRSLGVAPWFGGRLMVSRAGSVFDADGQLLDDKVREQLKEFMAGFAGFAAAR